MSLVKRTYVDQETVITAENLNAIQDAIIENEEAIGGKYNKPAGGIPASDTAAGVQTSLGKADSAYQKPSGGIPATDMASGVQTSLGKADSAYQKPSGGIPSTDLASTVQTSLGKADSSYQKPSGGIPATDMASGVQTSLGKADSSYQKPSGGIPSTDLASAVQTSLGKADTALQSSDIDSTLTVTGKAADAKKTGDEISDLKNTLTPSEWVSWEPTVGDVWGDRCWYRKISDHLVEFSVGLSGQIDSNHEVYTMPVGYWPSKQATFKGMGDSLTNTATIRIGTDGRVTLNAVNGYVAGYGIYGV